MSTFKDFNKIYKTFKDKIYNYFLFKTNFDKELSEDLMEEVFEKVIENINSLKDDGNLKVWIYKIAHNKLVDYFRKKKELLIFDDEDENIDSKIINERESKNEDINTLIDKKISLNIIKKSIQELSEKDRYIITLKFIDDLDYEELETILNKNKIAIRTSISRALKKLKDIVNKYQ